MTKREARDWVVVGVMLGLWTAVGVPYLIAQDLKRIVRGDRR